MKGEEILLSDLIESLEIIKLDNREEALIATYSFGIDVSSNYILIEPDGVSALKLFTRKGRYVADIGGVGQGPGEYKYAVNRFLDEKQGRVAIAENKKNVIF
ncbi:6-bladed beta-propeller [Bacteroides fragilis]|nr:6-bladed beta-propeller [Bacteroides fragilis]